MFNISKIISFILFIPEAIEIKRINEIKSKYHIIDCHWRIKEYEVGRKIELIGYLGDNSPKFKLYIIRDRYTKKYAVFYNVVDNKTQQMFTQQMLKDLKTLLKVFNLDKMFVVYKSEILIKSNINRN